MRIIMEEEAITLLGLPTNTNDPLIRIIPRKSQAYYRKYCTIPIFLLLITLFALGLYSHSDELFLQFNPRIPRHVSISGCDNSTNSLPLPPGISPDAKVILFWTKFFDGDNPYLHDHLGECRNKHCFLTDDRRYLHQSHAVIFHIRDTKSNDLPKCRNAQQLFVFFLAESPHHTGLQLGKKPWPGFFNLTWTYRLDSDIFAPFYLEKFRPTLWQDRNATREFLRKKSDRAFILSSNCQTPSHREDYIRELQAHFPVDMIGQCSRKFCPRSISSQECENRTQSYKFYLAFENSNCLDYMTEKVIRPLNMGTIPVVLGGGNYSLILPKNSFIATADFASPKDLAVYLWMLARNVDVYDKFYEWRFDPAMVRMNPRWTNPADVSICRLCEILHDKAFPPKSYEDIYGWWDTKAGCKSGA